MKLNLNFYNKNYKYSDGDIEDAILKFIKKYPNDYEEAFKEDSSWPVYYHLSKNRQNIISWYPFTKKDTILEVGAGMGAITNKLCEMCKSVTSVELSKRRATAILERNKKVNNLEIIVANFNDIKFNKKFDYILLNGVFEYSALYIESDNPFIDFLNKLKKLLKPTGKILIAIENKLGLKYWCGALEDHTSIAYDGLNDYPSESKIRTFSKQEFIDIAKNVEMNINFHYVYPDYKFPEVIFDDKGLKMNLPKSYTPYYCSNMYTPIVEYKALKNMFKDNIADVMANSFFIELSNNNDFTNIHYVKFNNYRNKEYSLITYCDDNNFYKTNGFKESFNHLTSLEDKYQKAKSHNIKIAKSVMCNNTIIINKVNGECLFDEMAKVKDNEKEIIKYFNLIFNYLKEHYSFTNDISNNIFDEYEIDIPNELMKELHFIDEAIIDVIPQNIFVNNGEFELIDQEWSMKKVPIEFIMYRCIKLFFNFVGKSTSDIDLMRYFCKFFDSNVLIFFHELDKKFILVVSNYNDVEYIYYNNYSNLMLYDEKNEEIKNITDRYNCLKNEYDCVYQTLNNIYNSRGYKLLNIYYKFRNKLRIQKNK